MNKLKVKFMLAVCMFMRDWYISQIKKDEVREIRVNHISGLIDDLEEEYKEE